MALLVLMLLSAAPLNAAGQDTAAPWNRPLSIHDVFAAIGERVPAFGGMFIDEDQDTLYVYVVPGEAGDLAQLQQSIDDFFPSDQRRQQRMVMLEAKYTFLQLKSWERQINSRIFSLSGVIDSGIADRRNRFEIGVESAATLSTVESDLLILGVPLGAVNVTVTSPVGFDETEAEAAPETSQPDGASATCDVTTIQGFCRPLVGGLRTREKKQNIECTLGFNATRGADRGFVTNGHNLPANLDGVVFFQPNIGGGQRISVEGKDCCYDPPFFNHKQNEDCPADRTCRYSDSAFVKLLPEVGASMGVLARPVFGSINWNGKDTFQITSVADKTQLDQLMMAGTKVTRVGELTGRVEGTIDDTCHLFGRGTHAYLCQLDVKWDMPAKQGDSGAPVFAITGKDKNEVQLVGILWATVRGVSPIVNVLMTNELGPTLQVCVTGTGEKKC